MRTALEAMSRPQDAACDLASKTNIFIAPLLINRADIEAKIASKLPHPCHDYHNDFEGLRTIFKKFFDKRDTADRVADGLLMLVDSRENLRAARKKESQGFRYYQLNDSVNYPVIALESLSNPDFIRRLVEFFNRVVKLR